jgi:recA bacterial DNA recombination protein
MANSALLRYADFSKPAALAIEGREAKFPALPLPGLQRVLENGLCRGGVAEVSGRRSSGRTSMALHVLAQATARGEVCAVIDLYDSFHPGSGDAAGVELDRLVWVRCRGNAEHAIRATDLLLHAGGFGIVLLDLCEAPARVLNRIPLSYWYRFRRAVEQSPAVLLICADSPQAKNYTFNSIEMTSKVFHWTGTAPFLRLQGLETNVVMRRAAAHSGRPAGVSILQVMV